MTFASALYIVGALFAVSFGIMGYLNAAIEGRTRLPGAILVGIGGCLVALAHISIPGGIKLVHVVEACILVLSKII